MRTASLILLLAAMAGFARGEDFTYSAFNGKDMTLWRVVGCEAGVEAGNLVIQAGDGLVVSEHRHRDFVFAWECKPRLADNYDSGIYFRCELPTERPFPNRYQINLRQNQQGKLLVKGVESKNLAKPNQWNSFKLTAVGTTASLQVNGELAWETDQIEALDGYIAIQVEVPGGGQYEFRNLHITEKNYTSLFDGETLEHWAVVGNPAASCWSVDDRCIRCNGGKGNWLRSVKQFANFNLRLQYKLEEGGNSGVYIRVPESGNHHGKDAGIEVQVLDDAAERYKNLKPYQYSASLYAIAEATVRAARPAGQWNSLEINCNGDTYRIHQNGILVVDANLESHPNLAERLKEGYFGLQNHSTNVWYRNLRIGAAVGE